MLRNPRAARTLGIVDQRHLAEGVPGAQLAQDVLAARRGACDLHGPLHDHEQRPARVPLMEHHVARGVVLLEEARGQAAQQATREPGEEGRVREKRRAPGLLGVDGPGEPPRQAAFEHGVH
jgi:hypothetical protein